jgi:DNA-directed RNA polymerase subunit L
MNPKIIKSSEENGTYEFTISGINVSLANAVRRTILSDIPINVIKTDTYETNECNILINTSRQHNEILKHRLSCIPIHIKELDLLPGKYVLEVDVKNDTDSIMFITTEQFKIKNKTNDNYLTEEEHRKIFPPSLSKTNMFIDFARLRPKISTTIPGEHIKLVAEFSIGTAKINSMYNVVSKCSYGNTLDIIKGNEAWEQIEDKLKSENKTKEEIVFEKKNFDLLDRQRYFIEDSFDFIITSIGIYENRELVKKACIILQKKILELIENIDADTLPINISETTMDNCFDVVLENEDYTIGKVLEYILYERYYVKEKQFSFCGFKKFHPHNTDSIIRIAYNDNTDKNTLRQHLRSVCVDASDFFKKLYEMF